MQICMACARFFLHLSSRCSSALVVSVDLKCSSFGFCLSARQHCLVQAPVGAMLGAPLLREGWNGLTVFVGPQAPALPTHALQHLEPLVAAGYGCVLAGHLEPLRVQTVLHPLVDGHPEILFQTQLFFLFPLHKSQKFVSSCMLYSATAVRVARIRLGRLRP